ncbi:MAG TPA: transposase [Nitrososphaerales archaeon]|nr:transposase [Nitrososphaerales archaeon]
MLARKSVKQSYHPNNTTFQLMESFRQMTNECIQIGLRQNISTLKTLSLFSYRELKRYDNMLSYYKLCAISKAAGILSSRKKSLRRGYQSNNPYVSKLVLTSCYGFKLVNGNLVIPVGDRKHESIALNAHTLEVLSDPTLTVCSFTLTENSLSLCISREVQEIKTEELVSTVGVDRNLENITVGNANQVIYYDISKTTTIAANTRSIISSFKRNDKRIGKQIRAKHGKRRTERTKHILHQVSKDIVQNAKTNKQAIVFEEISTIRNLYRKGNLQGRRYRAMMNSAPFGEIKRQVEYKAAWEGVPVITLTRRETSGTTVDCPKCGERLQSASQDDIEHHRQMWCGVCMRWRDRDLVAVMNISRRGWLRFDHSEGEASEAVRGNPEHEREPVILRVDASKFGSRRKPRT